MQFFFTFPDISPWGSNPSGRVEYDPRIGRAVRSGEACAALTIIPLCYADGLSTRPMADVADGRRRGIFALSHSHKHRKSKAAGRARRETPDGGVTRRVCVCVCVCAPWLREVVHPVCGYRNLSTVHSGMVPYSPPAHRGRTKNIYFPRFWEACLASFVLTDRTSNQNQQNLGKPAQL